MDRPYYLFERKKKGTKKKITKISASPNIHRIGILNLLYETE